MRLPLSTLALLALIVLVQVQLWLGNNGKPYAMNLELQLTRQQAANEQAHLRNTRLEAEVRDLREGLEMVEERARWELGMVKPDEILVQVTPPRR
ncbi:MAG: septum formation initiator family protein [Aquincola sp.]|nr:septum formation initiator family protein [Aquincola sp.]MDH4289444.1 septum formation initiator family protein [Aquincola sp.]MDH5330459.1 septum formation initiator family protein [Aquincola sp.]